MTTAVIPCECGAIPQGKFSPLSRMVFYKCMECGAKTVEHWLMSDARRSWNAGRKSAGPD